MLATQSIAIRRKPATMPVFCAAYGCNNRRNTETKSRGITFHKFPKDRYLRKQWEVALRKEGFVASESSKLCSEHFKPDEFDRTGQTVRLRDGTTPSVFKFPSHLQRTIVKQETQTSRKAQESLPVDLSQRFTKSKCDDTVVTQETQTSRKAEERLPVDLSWHFTQSPPQLNDDHSYALPSSPTLLKARLSDALARVASLEREKLNAKARERRAKKTVECLLEDLKEKNLINDELKERLNFHSNLQINLFSKQGHEYTKEQREFAQTLHLHCPKAYSYLRDSMHLPLPHPHTLQRWTQSVNAKPEHNTMQDISQKRCEEDHATIQQ